MSNTIEKVLRRLIVREPDRLETGCWEWPGRRCKGDYAQISFQRKLKMVYRLVWEHLRGPIPTGRESHHRCRNRICCNPDHIVMLTPAQHRAIPFHPFVPSPTREKQAPNQRILAGTTRSERRTENERRNAEERTERERRKEARRSLKAETAREAALKKERRTAAAAQKKQIDAIQKEEKRQRRQEVLRRLQEERALAARIKKESKANAPCPQGHPRTVENIYTTPQGHRQCRLCREAQSVLQRAKPLDATRKIYRKKTVCAHGHPYTEENTYTSPKGAKFCRACQRVKDKARYSSRAQKRG